MRFRGRVEQINNCITCSSPFDWSGAYLFNRKKLLLGVECAEGPAFFHMEFPLTVCHCDGPAHHSFVVDEGVLSNPLLKEREEALFGLQKLMVDLFLFDGPHSLHFHWNVICQLVQHLLSEHLLNQICWRLVEIFWELQWKCIDFLWGLSICFLWDSVLVVIEWLWFERRENDLDLFDKIEPLRGDQAGQDVEEVYDWVIDKGLQEVRVFDKATKL